jgi:hypothetical protein
MSPRSVASDITLWFGAVAQVGRLRRRVLHARGARSTPHPTQSPTPSRSTASTTGQTGQRQSPARRPDGTNSRAATSSAARGSLLFGTASSVAVITAPFAPSNAAGDQATNTAPGSRGADNRVRTARRSGAWGWHGAATTAPPSWRVRFEKAGAMNATGHPLSHDKGRRNAAPTHERSAVPAIEPRRSRRAPLPHIASAGMPRSAVHAQRTTRLNNTPNRFLHAPERQVDARTKRRVAGGRGRVGTTRDVELFGRPAGSSLAATRSAPHAAAAIASK